MLGIQMVTTETLVSLVSVLDDLSSLILTFSPIIISYFSQNIYFGEGGAGEQACSGRGRRGREMLSQLYSEHEA